MQTCYRHPSRETGVSCSSCDRPICTDCMIATNVGMRCPECAKQKTKVHTMASISAASMKVTQAIIVVNVVVFLLQTLAGGGGIRARSGAIYEQGVLFGPFVDQGEWWRLLTSGFMHADPFQLLLNMAGVYFLGQIIEPALGAVRYVALYLGSLLMGSLGALVLSPDAATIGASGAVFGLLGAAFILMRQRGVNPMQTFIGPILLLNILFTFRPGISIGGHFGGLLGGVLCALIVSAAAERGRRGLQLGVLGCAAIGLFAAVGGVIAAGTPALYG